MGEVWNGEQLEIMLLKGKKVIINQVITLESVIENVIFTQKCFVQPNTYPIILESDFMDIYFVMLDKSD